jgi:ribosomal protein L34
MAKHNTDLICLGAQTVDRRGNVFFVCAALTAVLSLFCESSALPSSRLGGLDDALKKNKSRGETARQRSQRGRAILSDRGQHALTLDTARE